MEATSGTRFLCILIWKDTFSSDTDHWIIRNFWSGRPCMFMEFVSHHMEYRQSTCIFVLSRFCQPGIFTVVDQWNVLYLELIALRQATAFSYPQFIPMEKWRYQLHNWILGAKGINLPQSGLSSKSAPWVGVTTWLCLWQPNITD